jgi:hypothetical protein
MKLYLYCKYEDAETIVNVKYLRISIPNRLNDPFELLGQAETKVHRKDYDREMSISRVRKAFHRNLLNAGYSRSYAKFQKEMEKDPEYFFELYQREVPISYERMIRGFLDELSEKHGFICLSKTFKSILMWSHYAEKHRGVVLGFDTTKMGVADKYLAPVDYKSTRVRLTATIDPKHEGNLKAWENLVRRKHIDWKYEEEVRIIGYLNDKNEKGEYPIPFLPSSLDEVYFGWKCENEANFINLLMKQGFQSQVYKMKPHPNDFSLEPVPFSV